MGRYDFWVHGVATVVEHPERAAEILHAGWGTLVRQGPGGPTNNWFHLPIPTPTVLDSDDEVALVHTRLVASVNENAEVRQIDVRIGGLPEPIREHVTLRGPQIDHVTRIGDQYRAFFEGSGTSPREINQAVTLCVRVEFLDGEEMGSIVFQGAGARFDE